MTGEIPAAMVRRTLFDGPWLQVGHVTARPMASECGEIETSDLNVFALPLAGVFTKHDGPPAHAPWQGQDPTGDDLTVLRALNENYVNAFRNADVAWYDAHLAPDYVVVSGDGSFQDRAAALANFAKPWFATTMVSFPVDKVNIRRFDDVALIHAENAYALKDGRKGVSRYTDIWYRHGGRWQCIAAHITVHKAPAM